MQHEKGPISLRPVQRRLAFLTLLLFGASILVCTWGLSALPSIQLRLAPGLDPANDIFSGSTYANLPVPLWCLTGLFHTYFVLGIIALALFIYCFVVAPPKTGQKGAWQEVRRTKGKNARDKEV